jgi:hypothetical protein
VNKTEAAQVLAVLASPHNRDVSVETAEVWYRAALSHIDVATGLEVAMSLVESEERFPTPARFNTERRRIAIRQRELERLPALPPATTTPTDAASLLAETRKMLEDRKANQRKHWHGGPNPCPVCGGLVPVAHKNPRAV